jgi:hypothetical protein
MQDDTKTYEIRTIAAGPTYMLDIAKYDGNWLLVAGAPAEHKTYIYKNPIAALNSKPDATLVPLQVLKTENPTRVSFSDNTRFIMAENGQQFSVYDAEYDKKYAYNTQNTLDAPQVHAKWMDGHRLMYVSGGKVVVFDYDNTNSEQLVLADAQYGAFFDRSYAVLYALTAQTVKNEAGQDVAQYGLTTTPLRAPQDR